MASFGPCAGLTARPYGREIRVPCSMVIGDSVVPELPRICGNPPLDLNDPAIGDLGLAQPKSFLQLFIETS
jgi:hypothetical protein